MTPEQQRRVRDLFEQAVDRDPADRDAWLAATTADDGLVRAEVSSLLGHHAQAGAFLSEPVSQRVPHLMDETPQFSEGAVLGPYTVVREIGRGGMGRVYLARDNRLGRLVALKALPPSRTRDPSQRERLRREARAAALLTHPGICTIYALEEIDDDVFVAAEFVDGHSLREDIGGSARPTATDVLDTARALAEALASAHAKGVTHRDLKPENVMRGRDGRLKILDFGLARIESDGAGVLAASRLTQPGTLVGTPAYMAPEQLNGGASSARSDVFALGVLLYEYATGAHPFDAQTPLAFAARILEGEHRPLSEVRPDLASPVVIVVERCLRKAPAARFASAGEVAAALDGQIDGPFDARQSGRVTTWWRTHQGTVIALYVVACATAWQIKEWQHGFTQVTFLFIGVAATVAGVFRGHLLFAERMNRASFPAERRRADPVTRAADLLIGAALVSDGLMLMQTRPVAAVLTCALAIGIGLARVVVEPATSEGAFGGSRPTRGSSGPRPG